MTKLAKQMSPLTTRVQDAGQKEIADDDGEEKPTDNDKDEFGGPG
jgi:uncharacterized coiled-coil protein SlyX